MAYHSLFDNLSNGRLSLNYTGTLEAIIFQLAGILKSEGKTIEEPAPLILAPPRIIRAIIDYKIEQQESRHETEEIEALLRRAIQLGLDIYCRKKDGIMLRLATLANDIKTKYPDLYVRSVEQHGDTLTEEAQQSTHSQQVAESLVDKVRYQDILFIALGHGGTVAGMDTFLRYCHLTNSRNSEFYVVRFSTQKCKDKEPQLSDAEVQYLIEATSKGRPVVIFDEDRYSGRTLDLAEKYFSTKLPGTNLMCIANYEVREMILPITLSLQQSARDALQRAREFEALGLDHWGKPPQPIISNRLIKYQMENNSCTFF